MSKNTIEDLREMLFETARALKNKTIDIDRAVALKDVAQVIVNTAKVEIDFVRISGGSGSGFIPNQLPGESTSALPGIPKTQTIATQGGTKTITQLASGATVTQHKMRG